MRVWLLLLSLQPPHYQAYDVPLFYRDDQPETADFDSAGINVIVDNPQWSLDRIANDVYVI